METRPPLVSVVIPVFNRAHVLRRAIDSVLAQSLADLELIVVDDGSSDASPSLAEVLGDPRIRVLRGTARRGVSAARNRGIAAARADLVAFLDSDDEWLPRKLECQVTRLQEGPEPATVVYCAFAGYDDVRGRTFGRPYPAYAGDVYRQLLAGWHPVTASVFLVTRAALQEVGGFDEQLPTAEDYDLWLRLARAGHRFAVVKEVLAVKHEGTGQLMRDVAARRLGERRLRARWGSVIAAELGPGGYRAWRTDRRLQLRRAMQARDGGQHKMALVRLLSPLSASWPFVPAGVAAALGRRGEELARRVQQLRSPADAPAAASETWGARVGSAQERGVVRPAPPVFGRSPDHFTVPGTPRDLAAPGRATPGELDRHTFVFICGLHRSGTTLLFELLREHPQISGFRDTGAPRDEGQHLQTVYPSAASQGRPGQFGFNPTAHVTESSPIVSEANRRALFAQWARYWDLSRPFLLEKSPPNLVRTRFLQALFPRSRFIVITRHPVPVALSTRRWVPVPLYSLVHHWVVCHEIWAVDRPFVRDVLTISYEGLVADPAGTLRAIAEFLGTDPFGPSLASRPDPSVNARYFALWTEFKRRPRGRLSLGLTEWRFERRIRPWGYSFRRTQHGADTAPGMTAVKVGPR